MSSRPAVLDFGRRIADKQVPTVLKADPGGACRPAAGEPELQHKQAPGGVRWPLVPTSRLSVQGCALLRGREKLTALQAWNYPSEVGCAVIIVVIVCKSLN